MCVKYLTSGDVVIVSHIHCFSLLKSFYWIFAYFMH